MCLYLSALNTGKAAKTEWCTCFPLPVELACLFQPYTQVQAAASSHALTEHTHKSVEKSVSSWLLCRVVKHMGRVSSPGVAPVTVKKSLICVQKSFQRSARSYLERSSVGVSVWPEVWQKLATSPWCCVCSSAGWSWTKHMYCRVIWPGCVCWLNPKTRSLWVFLTSGKRVSVKQNCHKFL